MKIRLLFPVIGAICAAATLSQASLADDAACNAIEAANTKSYSGGVSANTKINKTGVDFAKDTPKIYGNYTKLICTYMRDELSKGELASLYTQRYESTVGITNAQIWISKKTGLLLREELDGDLGPKGKGHESMVFSYAK
jgi:hypothetical protein